MGILKNQLPHSALGLKGNTPSSSKGFNTFTAPGSKPMNPESLKGSSLDLDGLTPKGYQAPESGIADRLLDLTK